MYEKKCVHYLKQYCDYGNTLYPIIILYEQQSEYPATPACGKIHKNEEKEVKEKQKKLKVENHINSIILPVHTLRTAHTKIKDTV